MRIAIVTASFFPSMGGASFVVHHLAHQWTLQGHNVCVINALTNKVNHLTTNYSVHKYPVLRGAYRFGYHRFPFSWFTVRKIRELLQDYKPNLISAHFGYPVAIWLSQLNPVPKFLITCHGGELSEKERPRKVFKIESRLVAAMNKAHRVIAISSSVQKTLQNLGVSPSRIVYIPNGVDRELFKKSVSFNFREYFSIPSDSLIILSVGHERPAKAFDIGIRAFAQLHVKLPNTYYVILGAGTEKWLPLATELGIEGNVIFHSGLYDDALSSAYLQSDIFFSPSMHEACPLVVLEAMAAGLPEVVTNVSGSQDVIQPGINGIVVEPGNIEEMANALLQLACDKPLRNTMGAANIVKSQSYDWDKISRMYLEHA